MRCLTLLCALLLLACQSESQEVLWSHTMEGAQSRMVTDASGTTFVARLVYGGSGSPVVVLDGFSSTGVHSVQMTSGSFGSLSNPRLVDMGFSANAVFVGLTGTLSSESRSLILKFTPTTLTFSQVQLQADGISDLSMRGMAVGTTSTGVTLQRGSDGAGIIQRRQASDGTLVNSTTYPNDTMGEIALSTPNTYVANSSFVASGNTYLRVSQLGTTLSFNSTITGTSSFTNLQMILSRDGTTVWSAGQYSDISGSSLYVRPFTLSSTTFGGARTVAGNSPDLMQTEPKNVIFRYRTNIINELHIAVYTPIAIRFTKNLGAQIPDVKAAVDPFGNLLLVVGDQASNPRSLRIQRIDEVLGLPINSTSVLVGDSVTPRDVSLDAAGRPTILVTRSQGVLADQVLLKVSPMSVTIPGPYTVGGDSQVATVSIGDPAPTGGALIQLFSNNASVTVPASVTIPAGQSSTTFTVNTTPVAANAAPIITARYDGLNAQRAFDLAAPLIHSITATPQSQAGGVNITGRVTLTGLAPAGGKIVSLTSSNPSRVTVPSAVTVTGGNASRNFIISTVPTLVNASSVVTATTGAVSKTVFIAVVAPVFQTASLLASAVQGGVSTTIRVTLGSNAPSGYTVTLLSGAPSIVTLPSSFAVPAGTATVDIPVLTSAVTSSIVVNLVAYRGPYVKAMSLTVNP